MKIFVQFNSTQDQEMFKMKGYRWDVYVKKENMYNVSIYTIFNIEQDFNREVKEYGFFSIEPNLIIVDEITNKSITQTIAALDKKGFFDYLKPVDDLDVPTDLCLLNE